MSVFNEVLDLMSTNDIRQTPYDRAAENLGVPVEESRDAVRRWFYERGYNLIEGQPLVDEDLPYGVYIMVGDDLYKCAYARRDYWLSWYPEEAGGTRFDFDDLAYTGYPLCQFVWDEDELWLIAVG